MLVGTNGDILKGKYWYSINICEVKEINVDVLNENYYETLKKCKC